MNYTIVNGSVSYGAETILEEIYTDYVKVGEINSEIDTINKEIEESFLKWEENQSMIEELG